MALYHARPQDGAAWITGASEGLGRALALKLAGEGWVVYASARNAQKLDALAASFGGAGKIIPLPLDVTDRAAQPRRSRDDCAPMVEGWRSPSSTPGISFRCAPSS